MTRNLDHVALPRGGPADVSARLAAKGVTLAAATISSVLNYVRGGKSGKPLRSHVLAQELLDDPAIKTFGLCLNDILDPPIGPVRVWPNDTPADVEARARAEWAQGEGRAA